MKLKKVILSILLLLVFVYALYFIADEKSTVEISQREVKENIAFKIQNKVQEKSNLSEDANPKQAEEKPSFDKKRVEHYPKKIDEKEQAIDLEYDNHILSPEQSEINEAPKESSIEENKSVERYSKLDQLGNLLPTDALSWSCVLDIETGLVWEIKTVDEGYHNTTDRFVWFDENVESGVFTGSPESGDTCSFFKKNYTSFCNTKNFSEKINSINLCGFSNWHLPTLKELNSIIVSRGSASVVDEAFFINTQKGYYWTAEPVAYNDRSSWAILFHHGAPKNDLNKTNTAYARLVAGKLGGDR